MKILVVEDSPLVRAMYNLVFPARANTLVNAENGRAALDHLATEGNTYELILLDLRMPDMDGVEFLEALQQQSKTIRSIPIVLTTAEPEGSELVIRARALGASAIVHKPWRPAELREAIKALIPTGLTA